MRTIEITPASIAQVARARDGTMVEVSDDVQGVAVGLNEIDKHIRLRYSEAGEYYVVYWLPDECEPGDGYLIFTAQELDHRIVEKMQEVYHRCQQPGYSFSEDLDKEEEKLKAAAEREWEQKHGEMYERLAHGMRRDLGYDKGSISTFVPEPS